MNKKVTAVVWVPVLVVVGIGVGILAFEKNISIPTLFDVLPRGAPRSDVPETIPPEEELETLPEVSEPGGLRGNFAPVSGALSASGTIVETNARRAVYGLPPLSFNAQLTVAAQRKVDDMIAQQYFEHVSPQGLDVGDLVGAAGYAYLSVGENLALGNYENDTVLVQAWMDSPGHRENILSEKYTEIGVAVGQGVYEGHLVWFAVQEFGRPASLCPSPDKTLASSIDTSQELLEETQDVLEAQREALEDMEPKQGRAYNERVDEYNALVRSYNELLEETKELIETYNEQVREYNACVQH